MSSNSSRQSSASVATPSCVAFLLCGGLGTRLQGVTDRPKATLEIAGWPFLRYQIEMLRSLQPKRIVFLVGHGAQEVEQVFGPASQDRVFVTEETPLGTGGALAAAKEWAGERNWIANGDSFVDLSAAGFLATHRAGTARIAVVPMMNRTDYGGVEIDEDERIIGFAEKGGGSPGWINAGVYLIDSSLFDELSPGRSSLEKDHFPRWAAAGRLFAYRSDAFFRDIGTPERLTAARSEFATIRSRMEAEDDCGAR